MNQACQKNKNDHSAQETVVIQKRMKRFEFGMQDGCLNQLVGCLPTHVMLPCVHRVRKQVRSNRDISSIFDTGAVRADPDGYASILTGSLALSSCPFHESGVGFSDNTLRTWQGFQKVFGMAHG